MTDRAALRAEIRAGYQKWQARQDAADRALLAELLAAIATGQWDAMTIARRIAMQSSDKAAAIWLMAECLNAVKEAQPLPPRVTP